MTFYGFSKFFSSDCLFDSRNEKYNYIYIYIPEKYEKSFNVSRYTKFQKNRRSNVEDIFIFFRYS
jgi:hypothetical protein